MSGFGPGFANFPPSTPPPTLIQYISSKQLLADIVSNTQKRIAMYHKMPDGLCCLDRTPYFDWIVPNIVNALIDTNFDVRVWRCDEQRYVIKYDAADTTGHIVVRHVCVTDYGVSGSIDTHAVGVGMNPATLGVDTTETPFFSCCASRITERMLVMCMADRATETCNPLLRQIAENDDLMRMIYAYSGLQQQPFEHKPRTDSRGVWWTFTDHAGLMWNNLRAIFGQDPEPFKPYERPERPFGTLQYSTPVAQ